MSRNQKPAPIVTAQVCSVCGLPWDNHGPKPDLAQCVELLKQALAAARSMPYVNSGSLSFPHWTSWGAGQANS